LEGKGFVVSDSTTPVGFVCGEDRLWTKKKGNNLLKHSLHERTDDFVDAMALNRMTTA
jgi:hypothetical protein